MRSPSATSSGPTVQITTMLVFPRSDIASPSMVRSANWVRVRRRGGTQNGLIPCVEQVRDVHGGPGGRGRDRVERGPDGPPGRPAPQGSGGPARTRRDQDRFRSMAGPWVPVTAVTDASPSHRRPAPGVGMSFEYLI